MQPDDEIYCPNYDLIGNVFEVPYGPKAFFSSYPFELMLDDLMLDPSVKNNLNSPDWSSWVRHAHSVKKGVPVESWARHVQVIL